MRARVRSAYGGAFAALEQLTMVSAAVVGVPYYGYTYYGYTYYGYYLLWRR